MGQQEIYKLLKNNPDRWFSRQEICEIIEIGTTGVNNSLRSMIKYNEVEFKVVKINCSIVYFYKLK